MEKDIERLQDDLTELSVNMKKLESLVDGLSRSVAYTQQSLDSQQERYEGDFARQCEHLIETKVKSMIPTLVSEIFAEEHGAWAERAKTEITTHCLEAVTNMLDCVEP